MRSTMSKVGNAQPKSAMIEAEKAALERIKAKQQLEIEKMLEQEFTKKQIEQRNAEKMANELIRQQ